MMDSSLYTQSQAMFRAVLMGRTYSAVALEHGLSRSAIEQRIKALARELQDIVGVVGVDEGTLPTVELIRTNHQAYLEALEHYSPDDVQRALKTSTAATTEQIDFLVRQTTLHSRCQARDVALVLILFSTAAKPLEIARLEVRDYLAPDGSIREESVLRAEAAIGGKSRPLYFCSPKANSAIDSYLAERIQNEHGTKRSSRFRGLDPASPLFLRPDGTAMPVIANISDGRKQFRCTEILAAYRRIFKYAGLKGVNALSARRTVAQKLKVRGSDNEEIGRLLGLTEKGSVRRLLQKAGKPELKIIVQELV